jgi:hypothetical protein
VSQSLLANANAPADAKAPRTVDETGLPFLFLAELLGKILFQRGQLRLAELRAYQTQCQRHRSFDRVPAQ